MADRRLEDGFLRSWERVPGRPAVEAGGAVASYGELGERAAAIAATLDACTPGDGPRVTAVLAHRSVTAYAGVLAALLRGHAYVPLSPRHPPARIRDILERTATSALVVDEAGEALLPEVMHGMGRDVAVVRPGSQLRPASAWDRRPGPAGDPAYVLFTSGSTGTPKGVVVPHRAITSYVDFAVRRYDVTEHDRFAQMADLTFDASLFDLFAAWEAGACVCSPTVREVLKADGFIDRSQPTIWQSVPSIAAFMQAFKVLRPGRFPSLRWSLFGGEALPIELVEAWLDAAPGTTVENVYGPTELTCTCATYEWDVARSPGESELGIVPIGTPTTGMTAIVVDDRLHEVPDGIVGELLLTGPQLSLGYWNDPVRTATSFVVPPGSADLYYRTGDLARRREPGGPLLFHGRIDDQIKVRGHRVELGEVEAALRTVSGRPAVALGWPVLASGPAGIAAFVAGGRVDAHALRRSLARRLPEYMIPQRIEALDRLPLNANGKTDRPALAALLAD